MPFVSLWGTCWIRDDEFNRFIWWKWEEEGYKKDPGSSENIGCKISNILNWLANALALTNGILSNY